LKKREVIPPGSERLQELILLETIEGSLRGKGVILLEEEGI
jgi:hypothetical protein